jgi:hypothetical protein
MRRASNTVRPMMIAACALAVSAFGCKQTTSYDNVPAKPPEKSAEPSTGQAAKVHGPAGLTPRRAPARRPPPRQRRPATAKKPAPPKKAPAPAAASGELRLPGLSMTTDSGWVRQRPSNRMRLAQFSWPGKAPGQAATMTVSRFGGDVKANIARWHGQFQGASSPKTTELTVGGFRTTVVDIEGTFMHKARPMAPGPGTAKPGYALVGAVVVVPPALMFFKATGPKATIAQWRDGFLKALNTIKRGP